ncbi:hypothetical protein ZWY2020_010140 [Hordeum vulgare]|nr:hypothetical protein ZWY2020_010140 [Hordeum vulgare]
MTPIAGTAHCALSPPASSTAYPTACVCSASTSPTVADRLKFDIAIWNRFVIGFFAAALYLVYVAKQRVDAAAKAEDRAASNEDKSYKAALDKLEAPRAAVTKAAESYRLALLSPPPLPECALDSHVTAAAKVHCDAVRAMMSATGKAEEQKPIVGIARMGDVERRIVRGL